MTNSIYFLCGGNSSRSQIAEGYAKKYLPDWDVRSAGVRADGVNPHAIKIMADDNIDISQQKSNIIDESFLKKATIVVTLCGEARDKCVIPQSARWFHWPINDPALVTGNDSKITAAFKDTRDEIRKNMLELANQINDQAK